MKLKSEGTTLKSEANNQIEILKQNSDAESLLKIKCETDLCTPRRMSARTIIQTAKPINSDKMKNQLNNQIIAPITAINPKIQIIRKSILCPGIKEQISHENEK